MFVDLTVYNTLGRCWATRTDDFLGCCNQELGRYSGDPLVAQVAEELVAMAACELRKVDKADQDCKSSSALVSR